jgi:hypothetical protein
MGPPSKVPFRASPNLTRKTRALAQRLVAPIVSGHSRKAIVELAHSNNLVADTVMNSALQPSKDYDSAAGPGTHRASETLLQIVPYRSRDFEAPSNRTKLFIERESYNIARSDTEQNPIMEEATRGIRFLLDKWTTPGSAPVIDTLAEWVSCTSPDACDKIFKACELS